MKRFLTVIFCLAIFCACKKDSDTSTPTPNPTSTCRVVSATTAGGHKEFEIEYNADGKITKLIDYTSDVNAITSTVEYPVGDNNVAITSKGLPIQGLLNSQGYFSRIIAPDEFTGSIDTSLLEYDESNRYKRITKLDSGKNYIMDFIYTGNDLAKMVETHDNKLRYTVLYEYKNATVYKIVPPFIFINPFPYIPSTYSNRKIPTKCTLIDEDGISTVLFEDQYNVQVKDVTKDGTYLAKTILGGSSTWSSDPLKYTYEKCD